MTPREWSLLRQSRRDREAAANLRRANGVCHNCGVTHGQRRGPLIACVNGIAVCRECQQKRGIRRFRYYSEFRRLARRAKRENRGAWGLCGGMHVRG